MARRMTFIGIVACAMAGLGACATPPSDRDEQAFALARHYAMCLSPQRPAHSPELTDCVLARYDAAQREGERLAGGLHPVPTPAPAAQGSSPDHGRWPVWQGSGPDDDRWPRSAED